MKIKNIILAIGTMCILAACGPNEAYLKKQYPMKGPCFTWGGVEKGRTRAAYFCREANKNMSGIYCNRQEKHKGRHHDHHRGHCLAVWR